MQQLPTISTENCKTALFHATAFPHIAVYNKLFQNILYFDDFKVKFVNGLTLLFAVSGVHLLTADSCLCDAIALLQRQDTTKKRKKQIFDYDGFQVETCEKPFIRLPVYVKCYYLMSAIAFNVVSVRNT